MRIICRAPVRISLGNGGDTDYYIKETGWGCVLNATLSSHFYEVELNEHQDCKIDIVDYFDYIHNMNRTYQINDGFSELDLLRAALKQLSFQRNNCFTSRTNVPMHSGLGGSSSLAVAIISAILHYQKQNAEPKKVAELAYHIERNILKVPGGYQDQYAAAYGGFNYMEFRPGKVSVKPLKISEKTIQKLESNIILYYLKKREHSGSDVHKSQDETIQKDPKLIKKLLTEKRSNTLKIKSALEKGNLNAFAKLLKTEGEIKNRLSGKIANPYTENLRSHALKNGAVGGKISGAGSGGCMFFYVPENHEEFRQAMKSTGAIELNFRFQRKHEPGIRLKVVKEM